MMTPTAIMLLLMGDFFGVINFTFDHHGGRSSTEYQLYLGEEKTVPTS